MKNKKAIIGIGILVIVGLFLFLFFGNGFDVFKKDTKINLYDEFAQCITDSGAKFYCSWWAPSCDKQKQMFSSSATLLPYVECSAADNKQQNLRCRKDDIEAYPTWEFVNGKRIEDLLSFDNLEKETGCNAPVENAL